MKIAIVTGEYPPMQGGVGDFTREIARALDLLGHSVHVISHTGADLSAGEHVRVHAPARGWGVGTLWAVRRLVHQLSPDVVNIQYQAAAYGMTPPIHFLPSMLKLPTVVTFHDLRVPYLFPKAGALRQAAVRRLAHSARGVIVTNPEDHQTLNSDMRVRALCEIPIGSNIEPMPPGDFTRDQWRRIHGYRANDLVVGYFGFLNASKGGETLLHAIARVPNANLLLIGGRTGASDPSNESYARQIDSLAEQLGIARRIKRTGYLRPADTSAALLACDMMAMPYVDGASFRRGTFMACLAHGCATITTQPSVALPQLAHKQNVWLVPPNNPGALAEAIRLIEAQPELGKQLGAGARQLNSLFTWDKIARQTVDFFSTLTSS